MFIAKVILVNNRYTHLVYISDSHLKPEKAFKEYW